MERGLRAEIRISSSADAGHIDPRRLDPGRPRLRPQKLLSSADRPVGTNIQAFDAIVRSNGWDDATVVLQLLSHLEGDALNVALLVPEATRATHVGLVGALTDHYDSPERLSDNRRQFERTI